MCYILSMIKSKRRIYLDYASLTPIDQKVIREMGKYSKQAYANPSSLYMEGVLAKKALFEMRKKIADTIHSHSDEIVFTSGGTEANALALEGVVRAAKMAGISKPHIIISNIEHSSIIETANFLEKNGCEITRLKVDSTGIISVDELKKTIKINTVLVSIMTVNNEIGSIQPIKEIAKAIRQARAGKITSGNNSNNTIADISPKNDRDDKSESVSIYPLFHTDAAQAFLYEELYIEKLGIDLMTLDGSKIYGPRGIGCLFVKRGTPIQPIIYGGGQEGGMRSGTENLPAIAGFAKAVEMARRERGQLEKKKKRMSTKSGQLRNIMIAGLKKIRSDIMVNGENNDISKHSPHILNISIPGVDNEFFLFQLDARGIACSIKSSCLRDEEESYVLKAIGADSGTSIRFSFGRWTKEKDITFALMAIEKILSD